MPRWIFSCDCFASVVPCKPGWFKHPAALLLLVSCFIALVSAATVAQKRRRKLVIAESSYFKSVCMRGLSGDATLVNK